MSTALPLWEPTYLPIGVLSNGRACTGSVRSRVSRVASQFRSPTGSHEPLGAGLAEVPVGTAPVLICPAAVPA
jgi:hypothetical protein